MISKHNFTRKQQEALNALLEQDEVLISTTQSLAISDATAQDILKNLPESISAERKKVIKAAARLSERSITFGAVSPPLSVGTQSGAN